MPTIKSAAPQEIEIKFQADAAGLKLTGEWPVFAGGKLAKVQHLKSVYYDTESGDLRQHGIELRVRTTGKSRPVQTIKYPKGTGDVAFLRGEEEVKLLVPVPDIGLFDSGGVQAISRAVGDKSLQVWFETNVRRRLSVVSIGSSVIEIALDEGSVVAGNQSRKLCEVEFELKSGKPEELYRLALQAAEELPLSLDFSSKGSKGFHLREGTIPTLTKAKPVLLAGVGSREQLAAVVLSSILKHFTSNWVLLRESEQPEAVHQLRVSLRRLRSALRMLGRKMPQEEFEELRASARQIATAMGSARELDVFIQEIADGPLAAPECPDGGAAVLSALARRRGDAYSVARSAINGRDATLFVLRMQAFIDKLQTGAIQDTFGEGKLQSPSKMARKIMRKLAARVAAQGAALPTMSSEERHKLRIAFKNLRYGADFFGTLFGKREKAELYVERVSDLQDILGAQNDAITAKALAASLSPEIGPEAQSCLGFILGWQVFQAKAKEEALLKAWKNFRSAEPFWE